MPTRRSLTWRLVPWLVPVLLIVVGLLVVSASFSDSTHPKGEATPRAPSNVTALIAANAQAWSQSQVGPGITSTSLGTIVVSAAATGATTYSARAVVMRVDSSDQSTTDQSTTDQSTTDQSTVATCVQWNVDVSAKTVVAVAATEVRRVVGVATFDDTDVLLSACEDVAFGG